MALAAAVKGARHTKQTLTWQDADGNAQDLTGATLSGYKRSVTTGAVTALDGTLTITDAANGIFTWTYGANDVGAAGEYQVQFRATYGGQFDATIPANWTVHELLETA